MFKHCDSNSLFDITGGQVLKDMDYEKLKDLKNFMQLGKMDYRKLVSSISSDT